MSCTVVTSYYPIKSKYNKSQYLEWGKTFLKLHAPIVLFTEKELIPHFKSLTTNKQIQFIPIPFDELDTWVLYKDKWVEHHNIDPENSYHTPELYAIWAQKAFFVEKAIKSNYFNTQYFFWCDFGAFRNPDINNNILETFPQISYFSGDKLLLQSVGNLTESDKNNELYFPSYVTDIRIVGGLWGGSIIACLEWKRNYQKILEKYFLKGIFAGKDQIVMLSTYLKNPSLATVVKCTLNNIDTWFFLQYLLSNTNSMYELNKTYQIPIVSVNIMGGLGNQMFQLASSYAYSKNNNGKLIVLKNKKHDDGRSLYWDSVLFRFEDFLVDTIPEELEQWSEPGATEFGIIPSLTNKGLYLSGYLQSPKYFGDSALQQEIKHLFKPSPEVLDIIQNKYKILLDNKHNVVVVHARRTDYLKNQHMIDFNGPLPIEYYTKAINNISQHIKNPMYLLVSDDTSFWNESKKLSNKFIFILDDENDVNTLALLQQFEYFIIANSTFSWWAAWLSENTKKVIAPSKWFGPAGPKNYKDIYMPSWELI